MEPYSCFPSTRSPGQTSHSFSSLQNPRRQGYNLFQEAAFHPNRPSPLHGHNNRGEEENKLSGVANNNNTGKHTLNFLYCG